MALGNGKLLPPVPLHYLEGEPHKRITGPVTDKAFNKLLDRHGQARSKNKDPKGRPLYANSVDARRAAAAYKDKRIYLEGEPETALNEGLLALGITVKMNVRTGDYIFKWPGYAGLKHWTPLARPWPGAILAMLGRFCSLADKRSRKKALVKAARYTRESWQRGLAYIAVRPGNMIDPYLEDMKAIASDNEWDKVPRVDTYLSDYLGAEKGPISAYASWLLHAGPVKLALDPGHKVDIVPVLWGKKGTGKSTVIRYLLPGPHWRRKDYLNDTLTWRDALDSKIWVEQTAQKAIVELAENFGGRASAERVKQVISASWHRARAAYAEQAVDYVQRYLMTVTTNSDLHIPNDGTGESRRWVSVKCTGGPFKRRKNMVEALLSTYQQRVAETMYRLDNDEQVHPNEQVETLIMARSRDHIWHDESLHALIETLEGLTTGYTIKDLMAALAQVNEGPKLQWAKVKAALVQRQWRFKKGRRKQVNGVRKRDPNMWIPPSGGTL